MMRINVRVLIGGITIGLVLGYGLFLLAQPGRRRRGLAVLAGWALPGAGHLLLGKRTKGLLFLGLLGGLYAAGLWIAGFRSVDWDENPFYYVGQYGSGLTMLGARVLFAAKSFPRPDLPLSWYDPGLLYVCCTGLLNLVVLLNLVEVKAPTPVPAAAAPPAAAPEKPAA
jgi:hypothetical protein